jgi:endonuclease YncB( thermonuclease family)
MSAFALNPSRYLRMTKGGTPVAGVDVRMAGIDTPELQYPGNVSSGKQDGILERLRKNPEFEKLPRELKEHLAPRLEGAGSRQMRWADNASRALDSAIKKALRGGANGQGGGEPSKEGCRPPVRQSAKNEKRKLFLGVGRESFDCYGRLLAYVAPYMSKEEREQEGHPETFNLRMLREGWAVSYIHGGNMPKIDDLALVVSAVKEAKRGRIGFWAEREKLLHGYEFRALVRMAKGEKGFRYHVADLRDHLLGKSMHLLPAEEYVSIDEEYRVFY